MVGLGLKFGFASRDFALAGDLLNGRFVVGESMGKGQGL